MANLVGQTVGQCRIVEEVGQGRFAIVYKAWQESLGRYVALKVLRPRFAHDEDFVRRFRREARAAARLNHANIVTIHGVGQQDGIHYIVMELLEGQDLARVIQQEGSLPPRRVIDIACQVAEALEYAHARKLIHRDVKPSNIVVSLEGRATLTDFGIVKVASEPHLTQTGFFVGTPAYVSPEQARGKTVDHRSDIYSLGVVCYEMLAGRLPFEGDNTLAVLHAHAYETPPPMRSRRQGLPVGLRKAVEMAMAKDPRRRFQSAGEIITALRAVGVTPRPFVRRTPLPVVERPTEMAQPVVKPLPRPGRGLLWPIVGAFVAVLLLGGGLYAIANRPGPAPSWTPSSTLTHTPESPTDTVTPEGAVIPEPSNTPTSLPGETALPSPSATASPTVTTPVSTETATPTKTRTPTALPTGTPTPRRLTETPTPTTAPLTETPTPTPVPPTETPTPTPVPSTDTPVPPTNTPVPPTNTPVPPTDTPVPPTNTPVPVEPTNTPVPVQP